MMAMSEQKRAYMSKDMQDWLSWWGTELNWPGKFPIRSVLPLRVSIVVPRIWHEICMGRAPDWSAGPYPQALIPEHDACVVVRAPQTKRHGWTTRTSPTPTCCPRFSPPTASMPPRCSRTPSRLLSRSALLLGCVASGYGEADRCFCPVLLSSLVAQDQLKANTDRAFAAGVCGVPSYQVDDGEVIWGQDRLDVVADILCGWSSSAQASTSKARL